MESRGKHTAINQEIVIPPIPNFLQKKKSTNKLLLVLQLK